MGHILCIEGICGPSMVGSQRRLEGNNARFTCGSCSLAQQVWTITRAQIGMIWGISYLSREVYVRVHGGL